MLSLGFSAHAKEIDTNAAKFPNAPDWLTRNRAEKTIERIQTELEWTIRKIRVTFYTDVESFQRAHGLGPGAMAVTRKADNTVHLGPNVTNDNFDRVFAHELVHIILGQKYKEAIPKWVEEGLANHLGKYAKVDYAWLAKQPFPEDVRKLSHPFRGGLANVKYHYAASQALAEMISAKCNLRGLLQLSVGEKMDAYLKTYCEIADLNDAFHKWVLRKAG